MKTYETDVCVIAGGPAGLAAAVAAAENGAEVIILEKASTTGGAGNMGMGPLAVGSHIQRESLIGLTVEEAFRMFMDYTHWRVDARLVREYLMKSASTIDWLEDMGVEFADAYKYFPASQATWHRVKPQTGKPGPRGASIMYKRMTDRALELGVKILYNTPALELEKTDGEITAVIARDEAGETVRVACIAAVIATGGFGDNPQMIKEFLGYEHGRDLHSFRIPGLRGDGLKMAWAAGAERTDVNIEMTFTPAFLGETGLPEVIWSQPKNLVLNDGCQRFINEELLENTTFAGNAINRQHDRTGVCILDSGIVKHYLKHGYDVYSAVFENPLPAAFEADAKRLYAEGQENLCVAGSLPELARQLGLDPGDLEKAVAEYNAGCMAKEDLLFKNGRHLTPLKGPVFYAAKLYPSGYGTLGGIKINHRAEVVGTENRPIPGLYAAGTDACSIFGDSYVFILPGNTMGFAVNSGRIAGESAASFVFGEE